MANARSEIRNLRENSNATVAELKAFLRQLQGRSPQEMLGIVAGSQLIRAICISTAIVLAGGLLCTAIPFALGGDKKKEPAAARQTAGPTAPEPALPAPAGTTPAPVNPADGTNNPLSATKPDLSNLGVTEEKQAPPDRNPLENTRDNFLDGLE
jgi:hypothetical protein